MFKVLVNYNFTPEKDWMGDDYIIYDRSDSDEWLKDFPKDKIIKTANVGNADYDRLSYLVDNYDILPDVFLWSKTNLFKYISKEEYDKVKDNKTFTPLLTQNHKTYSDKFGVVCFYGEGMYHERNDSWYFGEMVSRYNNYGEFARDFQLPNPHFIPFNPGGNFILTREIVHKYGRDYYDRLRKILPYCQLPAEAHCCERSYYTIWHR